LAGFLHEFEGGIVEDPAALVGQEVGEVGEHRGWIDG
jgi:hypothetical protein